MEILQWTCPPRFHDPWPGTPGPDSGAHDIAPGAGHFAAGVCGLTVWLIRGPDRLATVGYTRQGPDIRANKDVRTQTVNRGYTRNGPS